DLTWSVDGGDEHTQTVSGVDIATFDSYQLTHDDAWAPDETGNYTITVSISNINGNGADDNGDNDSLSKDLFVLSQDVSRKVVIEEGTGTWCGWCPRGIVAMEYMYDHPDDYPNFIGIAVHNGDPMTVPEYDSGANFSGFPGSNVNRVLLGANVSQEDWVEYYNDRKDMMAPADLEMDGVYQYGTRELNLDVTTNFYTDIDDAHFALSVIVVENGVSGTDSNWGQSNYYSGGSQGPMGGFENLPQVVPASDMVY